MTGNRVVLLVDVDQCKVGEKGMVFAEVRGGREARWSLQFGARSCTATRKQFRLVPADTTAAPAGGETAAPVPAPATPAPATPAPELGDRVVYKQGVGGVFTVRMLADPCGHFLLVPIKADSVTRGVWASRDEFEAAATSPNRGTLEMGMAGKGSTFQILKLFILRISPPRKI